MLKNLLTNRYLRKHSLFVTDCLVSCFGKKKIYEVKEVLEVLEVVGIKSSCHLYFLAYFCKESDYKDFIKSIITAGGNGTHDLAIDYYMSRGILQNVLITSAFKSTAISADSSFYGEGSDGSSDGGSSE